MEFSIVALIQGGKAMSHKRTLPKPFDISPFTFQGDCHMFKDMFLSVVVQPVILALGR